MSEEREVQVELTMEEGFSFKVDFGMDGVDDLIMDEP